jgi:hypothetical protein
VSTEAISITIGAGVLASALAAIIGLVDRRSARRLIPIPVPTERRRSEDREQPAR